MSIAYQAHLVLSTRQLETGVAKDVSGVLRITQGAAVWEQLPGYNSEQAEYLYHIAADGGARVFERGS